MDKWEPSYITVGMENDAATLESSLEFSSGVEYIFAIKPNNSTPWCLLKRNENVSIQRFA